MFKLWLDCQYTIELSQFQAQINLLQLYLFLDIILVNGSSSGVQENIKFSKTETHRHALTLCMTEIVHISLLANSTIVEEIIQPETVGKI